jgi:2-oxoglutarate dehydrogenase E2 component (dihydrolipoamide succinyltransferase)
MEILVPELGESIVEATVARWLKKEGERVMVGEPVVELETDKVDLEVGAKEEGVLVKIKHKEGDDVEVGEVLGVIEPVEITGKGFEKSEAATSEPLVPVASSQPEENKATVPTLSDSKVGGTDDRATPVARRVAQEYGVELERVTPTGAGERITKEDVQHYLESQGTSKTKPSQAEKAEIISAPEPQEAPARRETREKMSRRRRTIASRLVEAQQTAAMLTTFNDIDMTAVIEIRNRRKQSFEERHGVKLGFMSFFVKASIGALKEFSRINSEIRGDEFILKDYYDIGIAIGAEEGLVVPVLRDADRLSFADIERKIRDFIEKSRTNTLSLEDIRGGTFTITNGGVFGSLLSTPILNPPQVGILGLHRIEDRPVAINNQVRIKPMMYVALSYDHRIVDGREAVQFLVRVKELIQDPETLLLEG